MKLLVLFLAGEKHKQPPQQRTIYDQAIISVVNEVLDGFNCTVFAYGQTGTGKTYTMEGGMRNKVMKFVVIQTNLFENLNFDAYFSVLPKK